MRCAHLTPLMVIGALVVSAAAQEYEVGPGDVLNVIVLNQAGLTGEFTVDPEGFMVYPFVGRVKTAGLSALEIERKLATLLSDGYLKRPQISVAVKQFRSHRVFVTGEAARPGPYGLRPDRMLSSLLQDIGELTPQAGHEILIIRPPGIPPPPPEPAPDPGDSAEGDEAAPPPSPSPTPPTRAPYPGEVEGSEIIRPPGAPPPPEPEPEPALGDSPEGVAATPSPSPSPTPPTRAPYPGEVEGSEIIRAKLREVRSGFPDKDVRLQIGDTIYFPKAAQVYMTGHVARPGSYRFDENMTVFQALALAGSVTERGSMKRVRIVRMVDGRRKELSLKLTEVLEPEDTVHVPERFF